MDGNCPHRFWVTSETDGEKEYCVELGAYPLGLNEQGQMVFNGSCVATIDPNSDTSEGHYGCRDFIYNKEPKLKKPENMGKTFRCKHIRAARDFALDFIIPHLVKADPNMQDHQLP